MFPYYVTKVRESVFKSQVFVYTEISNKLVKNEKLWIDITKWPALKQQLMAIDSSGVLLT